MIKIYKQKWLFASLILLMPIISIAAVPQWQIVPNDSSLTFIATQNGAPVTGGFKTFTGKIDFEPDQLNADNVEIVVDASSITDPYNQLADTLKGKDWFDVKQFPQAIFKSSSFTKTGNQSYAANGTLTIRDKTLPVTLTFVLEEYSPTKALVKGSTTIKRIAFGVGQGDWADTKTVKDDVEIDFTIAAVKK
jgi:polyisoprenoid-binding protein YceI